MMRSDENANQWEIWTEWIDMPEEVFLFYKSTQVALKKLINSQKIVNSNFQCRNKYVLPIFASDIYSVRIIMWVKIPFANSAYNSELAVDIFNGLRPKFNKGSS
ncbi:hypothetical protein Glove_228g117 [Diversispora epigaea]|uniref:Uncharacterized protein n=1 Tax=Diversispora epigaea TaxID=1348612 RepID=A0A397ILH4_9GLOM|nr:hypothetical protein Glove_228g117 [Diversispora epigaea]